MSERIRMTETKHDSYAIMSAGKAGFYVAPAYSSREMICPILGAFTTLDEALNFVRDEINGARA